MENLTKTSRSLTFWTDKVKRNFAILILFLLSAFVFAFTANAQIDTIQKDGKIIVKTRFIKFHMDTIDSCPKELRKNEIRRFLDGKPIVRIKKYCWYSTFPFFKFEKKIKTTLQKSKEKKIENLPIEKDINWEFLVFIACLFGYNILLGFKFNRPIKDSMFKTKKSFLIFQSISLILILSILLFNYYSISLSEFIIAFIAMFVFGLILMLFHKSSQGLVIGFVMGLLFGSIFMTNDEIKLYGDTFYLENLLWIMFSVFLAFFTSFIVVYFREKFET